MVRFLFHDFRRSGMDAAGEYRSEKKTEGKMLQGGGFHGELLGLRGWRRQSGLNARISDAELANEGPARRTLSGDLIEEEVHLVESRKQTVPQWHRRKHREGSHSEHSAENVML